MKKIYAFFLCLLILSLLLSSCVLPDSGGNEDGRGENTYTVRLSGEITLLNKTPSIHNEAGETVNFSLNPPDQGYLSVTLDGETLTPTVVFGKYRYSFVMPAHDVSLEIGIGTKPDNLLKDEVAITFVSLNDVHGAIEQNEYGKGGLSNTKAAIDKLSAFYRDNDASTNERDDIVLFANGDMFQGTAVSNMSHGRAVLEAMNAMGFDAMGVGNHEFDWGLDTVLAYWDGDESNGEANFPLVNSNIAQKASGRLIADESADDNIVLSTIVEKMGVKIGLIGAIGPIENSIIQKAVDPYTFRDLASSVKTTAAALKKAGAQIIAVSIHYGTASGSVSDCKANVELADLKDDDGNYLVDLIFNGHTHYRQKGEITRKGGTSVPVIQAGANNEAFGVISVVYSSASQKITSFRYSYNLVSNGGTDFDRPVEEVISSFSKELIMGLPTLAVSDVTVGSKYDLAPYVADIMIKATGADFSCGNFGGLRSNGDIVAGKAITEANVYEIIPFDNTVYLLSLPGSVIYKMMDYNADEWYFGTNGTDTEKLKNDSRIYTLAVIDFIYTGKYFDYYRDAIVTETDTQYVLRDLLSEDISLYGKAGERWTNRKGAKIGNVLQ